MTEETLNKIHLLDYKRNRLRWLKDIERDYSVSVEKLTKGTEIGSFNLADGDHISINPHWAIKNDGLIKDLSETLTELRKEIPLVETEIDELFNGVPLTEDQLAAANGLRPATDRKQQ